MTGFATSHIVFTNQVKLVTLMIEKISRMWTYQQTTPGVFMLVDLCNVRIYVCAVVIFTVHNYFAFHTIVVSMATFAFIPFALWWNKVKDSYSCHPPSYDHPSAPSLPLS